MEIVILNYDGMDLLPQCFPSVVEAARKASLPTQVVFLDNRSTDESPLWVQKNFPEATIFLAPANRFLCSFNNYLQVSDAEIAILLNNDIRVAPDFVDPLVAVFEKYPDAFLASPRVFSFDGSRYEGGRTKARVRAGFFWSSGVFKGHEALQEIPGYTFASGFGAFHRRRFLSLGGYDDLYLPGIIEDADLGFRGWRQGYRAYYVPESRVYHVGQASFKRAFGAKGILTLAHRNTFLFMWKNLSGGLLLEHLFLLIPRLLYAAFRRQWELIQGFMKALPLWHEAWKRREKLVRRAYSDRELLRLASGEGTGKRYVFKKRWKRVLVAGFDLAGRFLQSFFKRNERNLFFDPRKILVIRIDSMGDGVLSLSAIQALRKRFPRSQIDFLASPPVKDLFALFFPESKIHLLEKSWLTGRVILSGLFEITKKIKAERYDLAIDFRGDLRTILLMAWAGIPHRWGRDGAGGGFLLTRQLSSSYEIHEAIENLLLVRGGLEKPGAPFFLKPSLAEDPEVCKWLAPYQDQKKVVIHVGAGYPSKRWPTASFLEIARRIHEEERGVPIFVGGGEEKRLLKPFEKDFDSKFLNLAGKTTLAQLLALLKEADLYIGNDSGPAHLAALLDRKLLIIFSGANDFRKWAPWSNRLRLLTHPVPCSPCEERVCPLKRQVCLQEISVDEVCHAAQEMLQR